MVEIVASIADRITFATHQNDVPVIADLAIRNPGQDPVENIQLSLQCEPALIGSKTWRIDRIDAGGEVRIRDRSISLSGALLFGLNERLRAELRLSVTKDDLVLAEWRRDLTGLAKNEWGGAVHMPELLAAFVMPNDPSISKVLKQAGETLRRAGQQPAIDGYQSKSRQRVWQITSAMWSAISSRRLVYAEPPASFELQGQKVRTPTEVLETGLATCLDTALLFSASLEQAGLSPIIAFTKGHALCGVWLQPQQLPSLTTDDCIDLRKYVALKELVLFETTMVVSEPPVAFSKAVAEANRRISEEREKEFVYALDIKRARAQQITPLAATAEKFGSPDTTSQSEITQGLEAPPDLPGFDFGIGTESTPQTPETRLDHWKRKLLDLTKRNRLLNLKPSKTAILLRCPNPALLEDKLTAGKRIKVISLAALSSGQGRRDEGLFHNRTGEELSERFIQEALENNEVVSDMPQTDLDAGLVELYRKAKTDIQEGGANTLYLALGFLRWKQSPQEQNSYRAPLILLPVKLERSSAASKVNITAHDDDPVFNMTLLEMLRQDFHIRIPELEGGLPEDQSGINVMATWEIVKRAVRDVPGFEVVEDVVLSTFSFAKYLMWKDLADRTDVLKETSIVRHLIENPRERYAYSAAFLRPDEIDEKINPADLFMPLSADSSQIVAIHASAGSGDFVLEGPPGTGKSQTIANIIAHNLGLGRRVLFVSEKMAALEVVYRRLRDKGLGDFCLELHSNKANKRTILDQLGQSWRNRKAHSPVEWRVEADRLKKVRDDLNKLVIALHKPGVTGVSPRAAIGRTVRWRDLHRLRLDWQGGLDADQAKNRDGLQKLEEIAGRLGQAYSQIDAEDKEAFASVHHSDWSNAWQSRFVESCQRLTRSIDQLQLAAKSFTESSALPEAGGEIRRLRGLASIAGQIHIAASNNLEFGLSSKGVSHITLYESAVVALEDYNALKIGLSCKYPDDKILEAPLDGLSDRWIKATQSPWPIGPILQWLFVRELQKLFGLRSQPTPDKDLKILKSLQSLRKRMESEMSNLPKSTYWEGLDTKIDKVRNCIAAVKTIRQGVVGLVEHGANLPTVLEAVRQIFVDGHELLQPGAPIAETGMALNAAASAFEQCLRDFVETSQAKNEAFNDLNRLKSQAQSVIKLQPRINAWCRWQAAKREAESSGLQSLISALEIGHVEAPDAIEAFKTAYCIWLTDRIIDDRPELRMFSAVTHEEKIRQFCVVDQKLSEMSTGYIRAKLSEKIPGPEEGSRPAGYGILNRELQKKMRHKPIRQLVLEMGDALTTLTPCLLMSPLSVAQYLAAGSQMFDIVVFDEASQITVWDAVGAIARGRNAIIVGDPKQMPPTSFFDRAAGADSDSDNGENEEDLESVLNEALAASIKHHRLTGHYRSRHESLITFSNHRYYSGELITYPSAETKETAVSFVRVDGTYQRGGSRTNSEEAKAVIKEVVRRLQDPMLSRLSIGIVTLNSEQQRLIDNLLDQERRKNPGLEQFFDESAPEPVFVKNLETVQGDQRDVILLSVGYGPDTPGAKTMPMNFGPLNRKGGERRLNVAITRATSEVAVFASFDPSMIDLTRTSAQAVRDLKHYLEFAQRGLSALGEAVLQVGGMDQYESDFEEAVALGLRHKGWNVHTQIGVSKFRIDLGIVHPDFPGRYLAGIECDGAAYHSSPSARDRDRIRQVILENLNWKIVRVWSTDFYVDPSRTLTILHERLTALLNADKAAMAAKESSRNHEEKAKETCNNKKNSAAEKEECLVLNEESDEDMADADEQSKQSSTSRTEEDGTRGKTDLFSESLRGNNIGLSSEQFYSPAYLKVIQSLGVRLIDSLGPITFQHLSSLIARAHGFQKTGKQIKSRVWAAVSKSRPKSRAKDQHWIFWPADTEPKMTVPFRGLQVNGQQRAWRDVPYPEKLGLAVSILVESSRDNAAATMASKIGFGRLHGSTKEELEGLLEAAKLIV